nr:type II CAAX endopeptidase family protein [uncultured Carboxylicivirga sp.]
MKRKLPVWLGATLIIVLTVIVLILSGIIAMPFTNKELGDAIGGMVAALCLFGLVYWFRVKLHKADFAQVGMTFNLRDIGKGAIIALVMMSVGFLLLFLFDQIDITNVSWSAGSFLLAFLSYVFVGFYEEIVFRGYIQTSISESLNPFWGLFISSVLFALLHGLNPDLTLVAISNIFLAGFFIGRLFQLSKSLWAAIGFHTVWNFTQGPVYGFAVSGNDGYSLLKQQTLGPDYLTGGMFGFEGSAMCTVFFLVVIVISYHKIFSIK